MGDDFQKRRSGLVNSDAWNGFLGVQHGARYHTKAGVSSLYSEVYFLTDIDEEDLAELPDYVLSDTLQKDLNVTVEVCAMRLKESKYLPECTKVGGQYGYVPEGEREGAFIRDWKDFGIKNVDGAPLYTPEILDAAQERGETDLGAALWFIVKDICDNDGFLSQDWYRARIVFEYFRFPVVPNDSAYLIGELFKELCAKQYFEGDLAAYFQTLAEAQQARKRGTSSTRQKAELLRTKCVALFADLYSLKGPRLLLAPDETKAEELMNAALEKWPDEFQRGGKPYRKEWFLRHVIEDRRLEIAQAIEAGNN